MSKAIVIGGSRGMGKAITSSLNSLGYQVIATSKNEIDSMIIMFFNIRKFMKLN